jgi:sugar phosphate isomerase/epimerase
VDIPGVAKIAHELGIRYLTVAMAPEMITVTWDSVILSGVTGVEQLTIIADRLNKLGRESKENGLGLAYHNHQMEFTPLKELRGTLAFDFLMQETDPELVKIEFDVGWLTSAQVDPIEYLLDYGDRVIAVRLKDFNPALPIGQGLTRFPIPIMSRMVELGTGVVDFKRVLAVMDEIGVAHKFVQIDVTATPMETAKRSHEYLDSISA